MKTTLRLLAISVILLAFTNLSSAQTVKEAVEAYNAGATMIKENPAGALEKLYEALEISEELDYDGEETKVLAQSLIPMAHQQLAMIYYREKKMNDALEQLEKSRETAKEFGDQRTLQRVERTIPQLYNQMGSSKYRENLFEEAIENFKKALEINPNYPDPLLGIALSHEKSENYEQMLDYLKQTLDVSISINDRKKAEDATNKAVGYLFKNGDAAQKNKDFKTAIELFTKALEFDKTDGSIYFLLAINHGELKEWDKVVDYCNLALENPNEQIEKAGIYYQLGTAYQNLGKKNEACEAFSNTLSSAYSAAAEYQMKEVLKCN